MSIKYLKISFLLLFCIHLSINAQTGYDLSQAKLDYKNKEYAKALPVFEREYNEKPTNASLNLWYGICLAETNTNLKKAEECLLIAAKSNMPESYLYLGDIYSKKYRVTEAVEFYDRYAKAKPREKESTLKDRYEYTNKLQKLISRTEDIQIIDSIIVDKSDFLSAYKLSPDAGTLSEFNTLFQSAYSIESAVYTNGKGSKVYFGQPIEGKYFLSTMDKLISGFGNEKLMSENNFGLSGDTNYPYVMTDGVTAYFSGKDENGMGGYDIYVTRYRLDDNTYLAPQMLNMPFNSPANDYMMVVDEIKGVGWFATDRFQPEGKVCIYTFIPNEEVTLLDTDNEQYKESRARIASIKDTWKTGRSYAELIATARKDIPQKIEKANDFTFIIDDNHTYHTYSDFRSTTARNLYHELNNKTKELTAALKELEDKRNQYSKASANQKQHLSSQILSLEDKQLLLYQDVSSLERMIRNEEIKTLN